MGIFCQEKNKYLIEMAYAAVFIAFVGFSIARFYKVSVRFSFGMQGVGPKVASSQGLGFRRSQFRA